MIHKVFSHENCYYGLIDDGLSCMHYPLYLCHVVYNYVFTHYNVKICMIYNVMTAGSAGEFPPVLKYDPCISVWSLLSWRSQHKRKHIGNSVTP